MSHQVEMHIDPVDVTLSICWCFPESPWLLHGSMAQLLVLKRPPAAPFVDFLCCLRQHLLWFQSTLLWKSDLTLHVFFLGGITVFLCFTMCLDTLGLNRNHHFGTFRITIFVYLNPSKSHSIAWFGTFFYMFHHFYSYGPKYQLYVSKWPPCMECIIRSKTIYKWFRAP